MHAVAVEQIRHNYRRRASRPLVATLSEPAPDTFSIMISRIASEGDRTAFASLFIHFAPRVKSYMLRLGAEPALAEELAQETLLTIWRRAASFDPEKAAASTWIFRIARNLRIDRARRDRAGAASDNLVSTSDAAPLPDQDLLANKAEVRVRQALAKLPPEQAKIVRLSFFSDEPHSEIAVRLNLPLGTVKSRLRLAMGRLRELLRDLA